MADRPLVNTGGVEFTASGSGLKADATEISGGADTVTAAQARTHIDSTANPHSVSASQIGAAAILTQLLTVDGTTSGLDADLLDGEHATAFADAVHTHTESDITDLGDYLPRSGGTLTGEVTANAQVKPAIDSTLGTTGTLTLDFSGEMLADIGALTGNVTFAASNLAAGRSVSARVVNGATLRTLTFPAGWVFVGPKPTNIAASKTGWLTLTSMGTTDADVVAAWAVQE